jgi:hypothetical protein
MTIGGDLDAFAAGHRGPQRLRDCNGALHRGRVAVAPFTWQADLTAPAPMRFADHG